MCYKVFRSFYYYFYENLTSAMYGTALDYSFQLLRKLGFHMYFRRTVAVDKHNHAGYY